MSFPYLDAHAHVQFSAYDKDRDAVLARARGAGVAIVTVGTQRDTSRAAVELAAHHPGNMWATVGLHPIHTAKSYHDVQELGEPFSNSRELENGQMKGFTSRGEEFDYGYYRELARDPKVVAIGECGLDYFRIKHEELGIKEKQRAVFVKQIELAHEVGKPLMIHCRAERDSNHAQRGVVTQRPKSHAERGAFSDLIKILITHHQLFIPNNPGIIHFMSGTVEEARELLDLGFSFTFGGVITFARDYDEVIKIIPLDRILSETDAPYVTPAPYRGKRNEPAYVVEVVKKLAELKAVDMDAMASQIRENALRIYGISI